MLIIALVCVGGAVGLMVYLLGARVGAPADGTTVHVPRPTVADRTPGEVPPLYLRLASMAKKLTPAGYPQRVQHRLDVAGNPRGWVVERVMAYKGMGLLIGAVLGVLIGSHFGALVFLVAPVVAGLGFVWPDAQVRVLGERRHEQIIRGLPDATDMMTVCVEAGLGFDAALGRVARTMDGAVAEEFARVLQETQFGLSRAEALRALSGRTDVPELRTFATALVQASELGISVGDVLREQARELRIKRRQRAEERAQKLPVKILMPLITCLLPALFVVALGPAVLGIIHSFGSGGFLGG